MPTYEFRNKDTDEVFTGFLKIAEKEIFLQNNPHIEQIFETAPALGDSVRMGMKKIDNGFKEVLSKVAERNPASPLADQYRTKSIKEIKTRDIIAKHSK